MELIELAPGVYAVPMSELGDEIWFIRDDDEDDGNPLLHICEKSEEPIKSQLIDTLSDIEEPCWFVKTGVIYWDYSAGCYQCIRCAERWREEKELACIWEDGMGTGHEGYA